MNKLIIFALLSLTILSCATGRPSNSTTGENDEGNEKAKCKFFSKCALENCKDEIDAFKKSAYGPKQIEECTKKCHEKHNPDKKKLSELDEGQITQIKDCFAENKCFRNTTEIQNLKKCVHEKCPNDFRGPRFSTTPVSNI